MGLQECWDAISGVRISWAEEILRMEAVVVGALLLFGAEREVVEKVSESERGTT